VRLVAWRTVKNGQFAVRRAWRTANLLLWLPFRVNLPCAAPHDARQIDLIFFIFFLFSHPKIPKKHRHDIYIIVSITCTIYITICIIYVTISITGIIYNSIHHKCTPKSEVHRQVHTEVHNSSTSAHSSSQFIDKSTKEIKRHDSLRRRLAELWWEKLLLDKR
jgi:hypothetical protein